MQLFRINADGTDKTSVGNINGMVNSMAHSRPSGKIYVSIPASRSVAECPESENDLFLVPRPGRPNCICSADCLNGIIVGGNNWSVWAVNSVSEVVAPLIGRRGLEVISNKCGFRSKDVFPMAGICCVRQSILMSAPSSHLIFALHDDSTVSLAGGNGQKGFSVAKSLKDSMMDRPCGVCLADDEMLYVCDSGNGAIRKVDPRGMTHIKIYGNPNEKACLEGSAIYARMMNPTFISSYGKGVAFVDNNGKWIRTIESDTIRTIYRSDGVITAISGHNGSVCFTEMAS